MTRLKAIVATATTLAAFAVGSTAAFADNPHAGKSGHFKGSATPCPQYEQQCPPLND
jgi:Spy/CpxP family protein refolding chaperone